MSLFSHKTKGDDNASTCYLPILLNIRGLYCRFFSLFKVRAWKWCSRVCHQKPTFKKQLQLFQMMMFALKSMFYEQIIHLVKLVNLFPYTPLSPSTLSHLSTMTTQRLIALCVELWCYLPWFFFYLIRLWEWTLWIRILANFHLIMKDTLPQLEVK